MKKRLTLLLAAVCLAAMTARGASLMAAESAWKELAPLTIPVTSFGAAVAGDRLYVYGGQIGPPHTYSADLQANKLMRLDFAKGASWEVVAEGPRRTGLAMVAYEDKLYRIGGWEAKNANGQKWELYSTPDFARFNSKTEQWEQLAPLPRGRSSHDAAMVGSRLYVVGGWQLNGEGDGDWHGTAHVYDFADPSAQWIEIAKPPFRRRALAVAGYAGKLYVIGGMDDSNETTTAVEVYDPQSNTWSHGVAVPGESSEGFGIAAYGTSAGLFASGRSGIVYRWQNGGQSWTEVGKLKHPRYFHRVVATDDQRLIFVGGTTREGKVEQVELLDLRQSAPGQ